MDAGVPLKAPVSGIAMGLMTDGKKTVILSDIADAEDFAGDMDFKVTGTPNGITALQMDMKVHGLEVAVLHKALEQGKEGRAFILKHMLTTLNRPRTEMSDYAPRVESIKINPDKIREVIGKGGEMINKIIAETGAEIDIKDDGTVFIASPDKKSIDGATQWIKSITDDPIVGTIYKDSRVVSVLDFGAFVEILPGKEGLVHVSEMSEERVNKPSDVVKEGDRVTVKLVAIDDRGRLQLSMKKLLRSENRQMSQPKAKSKKNLTRSDRFKLLGLVVLALVLAYIVCSRAIDTGSWWEYGGTFVLCVFALNRFIRALSRNSHK